MSTYFNPYWLQNGIFMPYYILSSRNITYGAKLLYRVLEEHVDQKGETLIPLSLPAKILGTSQKNIFTMSRELASARLIELRNHPADDQFLRCLFLRPTWLVRPHKLPPASNNRRVSLEHSHSTGSGKAPAASDAEKRGRDFDDYKHDGSEESQPQGSRYSFKEILDYVFFRRQIGQAINRPYGLAKHLCKTGEQDEEIRQYLATEGR